MAVALRRWCGDSWAIVTSAMVMFSTGFFLWHVQDPGLCHELPIGEARNRGEARPQTMKAARCLFQSASAHRNTACVFVLLGVSVVKGDTSHEVLRCRH